MLDIKLLFNNISLFVKKIKIRFPDFDVKKFLNIYNDYRSLKFEIEFFQSKRNFFSKKFFLYKDKNKHILYFKKILELINFNIFFKKKKIKKKLYKLNHIINYIPNIPSSDVPLGKDDNDNIVILNWGKIKKYKFKILDHIKLGKLNNNLNFSESSIVSGSCFAVMKGNFSLLYRALSQFMLDLHILNNDYCEVYVPYIVKTDSLYGTGQLPKFYDDIFYVHSFKKKEKNNYALIPTSEVSLVNMFRNKLINKKELPIKLVSCTPCFRSESKSYGKNNRGLIRLKQFDKVELIQVVDAINSMKYLEELTFNAEMVLQKLNLTYRKVLLCSNSMSFSSCKTYDLEVWSPIDNSYIEVSSCSNTWDFQSRRINLRYFDVSLNKNIFCHIINGSGLAVGRTLVAILENNQVDTGIVKVPKVLIKYMYGIKYIKFI